MEESPFEREADDRAEALRAHMDGVVKTLNQKLDTGAIDLIEFGRLADEELAKARQRFTA